MQLARVLTDIVKAPADVLFFLFWNFFSVSGERERARARAREREREREQKKNLTVVYCAWIF
jgi:hypothetical protein